MGFSDRPRSGFGDRPRSGGFRGGSNFRRGGFNDGPREMHKTKCSECGQECEVPFKPTEGRPVYCKECFAKRNPRA